MCDLAEIIVLRVYSVGNKSSLGTKNNFMASAIRFKKSLPQFDMCVQICSGCYCFASWCFWSETAEM